MVAVNGLQDIDGNMNNLPRSCSSLSAGQRTMNFVATGLPEVGHAAMMKH